MARPRRQSQAGLANTLARLPIMLLAFGFFSGSMFVPAFYALVREDHGDARAFFYTGLLGVILFAMISIALAGRTNRKRVLSDLFALFFIMLGIPILLAFPVYEALRTTTFYNAYLEMVGAITTTGTLVFLDPDRLSPTLHLWRGQVAWMGGFVMWVAAASILAPLNLGGFEVTARSEPGRIGAQSGQQARRDEHLQMFQVIAKLFQVYFGLTLVLWIGLMVSGETALTGIVHAMSILSTSGISPVSDLDGSGAGLTGEVLMVIFLVFALSRLTFSTDTVIQTGGGVFSDPEIRLALSILLAMPLLLFLRHWFGAAEFSESATVSEALRAFWGSFFTIASFLTTTGFTSAEWDMAQSWSGLNTPGLILVALALIGGGVATTAGGVKLLRVFALYRHGVREMEQLVHPNSVSGARGLGRRLQRGGAYIAWVFFMLFAITLAGACLLFTAFGASFEDAMILAASSLSNTGPLLSAAPQDPISLAALPLGVKVVFCFAMVVGRIETLAVIALVTPDLWRA